MDSKLSHTLTHAATSYDIKESRKRFYNMYALGMYLDACAAIIDDVANGRDLRASICAHTNGRLSTALLRAVGLRALTLSEARGQ